MVRMSDEELADYLFGNRPRPEDDEDELFGLIQAIENWQSQKATTKYSIQVSNQVISHIEKAIPKRP